MAVMEFDDAAAEQLESMYLTPDLDAQRQDTMQRLALKPGEHVLDVGSGPGFMCQQMAEAVGPTGRVRGIDLSSVMIDRASNRNSYEWLSYAEGDATALPEEDQSYDVVVSVQVAEYVPDIQRLCSEAYRVLKPGGRALIMATDWDTVAWYTEDRGRMNRMLDAYKPHCAHSRLPQELTPHLREAGFTVDDVSIYAVINLNWDDICYSPRNVVFMANYVKSQGSLDEAEVDAWKEELRELGAQGRYFFSMSRTIFEVSR